MRFVVSKLRRTKENRKHEADIDEKTSVLDPKRHAKIIKKSMTKRQRKIIEKRTQNGAKSGPKTSQKSNKNVIEKRHRFFIVF